MGKSNEDSDDECKFSSCFLGLVDCCVTFETDGSREGDVAWSITTLYDPVVM